MYGHIYIYVEHVYLIIVKESDTYSIVKYKCILHSIYILCKIVVIKPDTLSFALLTNVFLIVECICCLPYESAFSVAFRSGLENFTFWFETFEYVRIFPFFCNRKARKARRARRARRARKAGRARRARRARGARCRSEELFSYMELSIYSYANLYIYIYIYICLPVVTHKAVAEVSKIVNL